MVERQIVMTVPQGVSMVIAHNNYEYDQILSWPKLL